MVNDIHTTGSTRASRASVVASNGSKSANARIARRHAGRRSQIIEAATQLVALGGVDALTTARLADAVDLTPGALYRYFRSLDEVLAEVLSSVLASLGVQLDEAVQRLGLAPAPQRALATLLLQAQVHGELALARPERFALLSLAIADPRQLVADGPAAAVAAGMGTVIARVADAFATARRCGALAEASPAHAPQFTHRGDKSLPTPTPAEELDDDQVRALTWIFAGQGLLMTNKIANRAGFPDFGSALDRTLRRDLLRAWGASATHLRAAERLVHDVWTQRPAASLA